MDTYKPGKILGQGSFGQVYEAMNMATGEMVAIKRIELRAGNEARMQQIIDAADQEIGMMRILRHPNVVSVLGCWMEERAAHPAIFIVMQLVPGRSIADVIKSVGPFHELVVRRFTKQLLQALEYCHSHRAVHRDIKGTSRGEVLRFAAPHAHTSVPSPWGDGMSCPPVAQLHIAERAGVFTNRVCGAAERDSDAGLIGRV